MTAPESAALELTADLVERVRNLSPAAKKSLGGLLEQDAAEEAEYNCKLWMEIRRRLDAYDSREVEAITDWRQMIAEIRAMRPEVR